MTDQDLIEKFLAGGEVTTPTPLAVDVIATKADVRSRRRKTVLAGSAIAVVFVLGSALWSSQRSGSTVGTVAQESAESSTAPDTTSPGDAATSILTSEPPDTNGIPTVLTARDRAIELNRSLWRVDRQAGTEPNPESEFVTIFEIGSPSDHIWFQDRCSNSFQIEWIDANSFRFVQPRPDVAPIECRRRGGGPQALGLLGVVGQSVTVAVSPDRLTLEGTGTTDDPERLWSLNLVRVESDQHGTHHSIPDDPTTDPRMIVSGQDDPGHIDAATLENGRILITAFCVVFLSDHTGDEVTLAFAANSTEFNPDSRELHYIPANFDITDGMLVSAIPTWELDARNNYFLPVQQEAHASCPPAIKVVDGIVRR